MNAPVRRLRTGFNSSRSPRHLVKELPVADLLFVLLTAALFAALTVLIRAVERS